MAVVISTPDRYLWHGNTSGPPPNGMHVREWRNEEVEILLLDQGMFPVLSGQECALFGTCGKGFTPSDSSMHNQIHVIGNTKVLNYIWWQHQLVYILFILS